MHSIPLREQTRQHFDLFLTDYAAHLSKLTGDTWQAEPLPDYWTPTGKVRRADEACLFLQLESKHLPSLTGARLRMSASYPGPDSYQHVPREGHYEITIAYERGALIAVKSTMTRLLPDYLTTLQVVRARQEHAADSQRTRHTCAQSLATLLKYQTPLRELTPGESRDYTLSWRGHKGRLSVEIGYGSVRVNVSVDDQAQAEKLLATLMPLLA